MRRLWSLAEREGQRKKCEALIAFDPIGLILTKTLGDDNYDVTPHNAQSFARIGGDGVHYNLLEVDGHITDESPVVMTVPMMGKEGNRIVGANLLDFLSLGCQVGYFWLEQLVYDEAGTIADLMYPERVFVNWHGDDYAHDSSHHEFMRQLNLLQVEFGLSPWPNLQPHLQKLRQDFAALLEFRTDSL